MWLAFYVMKGRKGDSLNLLYGKYILLQIALRLKYHGDNTL